MLKKILEPIFGNKTVAKKPEPDKHKFRVARKNVSVELKTRLVDFYLKSGEIITMNSHDTVYYIEQDMSLITGDFFGRRDLAGGLEFCKRLTISAYCQSNHTYDNLPAHGFITLRHESGKTTMIRAEKIDKVEISEFRPYKTEEVAIEYLEKI